MNDRIVPRGHARDRLGARVVAVVAFALMLLAPAVAPAAAQSSTPQAPPQNPAPAAQTTPAATAASSSAQTAPTTDPLSPGGVIAHGLVYLDGTSQVWQVIQQKPAGVSQAQTSTPGTALLFQRSGATIVRNDVTGKRARLEASRGYYESAGDPYTLWADSSSSTLWSFGLVSPKNVAKEAFYESPEMKGLAEGTYDLAMTRFILQPGDSVQLPDHTGPALVMAFAGKVNMTISGSSGALSEGDGQLVTGNGSVSNQGNQTAGFVFVAFGTKVSDQQPANSATKPAATTTANANATVTSNAPAANANPTIISTAQATQATQQSNGNASATQAPSGSERTSIAVTAQADIYVEVTADGVMMFQGNLSTGQTTGQIAGSSFTVYTSSGANTLFTNSCGSDFYMGNEQGEATYYLQAGPDSCPPSV